MLFVAKIHNEENDDIENIDGVYVDEDPDNLFSWTIGVVEEVC